VSVVLSITMLVPINCRSAAWTGDNFPDDWREQHQRWDRLHYARVVIITAGFVPLRAPWRPSKSPSTRRKPLGRSHSGPINKGRGELVVRSDQDPVSA
jgi:hypothetical protein